MPTSISNMQSLNNAGATSVLSTQQATYGDNPFLRLLTEQLRHQTPFEPVDNASFMSQMASYSSMQEQKELNANMLKLLDYQGILARVQGLGEGSALLGKDVSFVNDQGGESTAEVESLYITETGDIRLHLVGGEEIDMREVIGIALPSGS